MDHRVQTSFFETAVDSLPDVVAFLDPQGNVSYLNDAAYVFLGTTPEQALGRPVAEVAPAEIARHLHRMYEAAVAQAVMQEAELSGTLIDGEPYATLVQVVPVCNNGNVLQILVVSHDITARRIVECQRESYLGRISTLLKVSLDLLGVNEIEPLLDELVTAAQRLTGARVAMTSHLAANGEWTLGPSRRAGGVMPSLLQHRFMEMRGGLYKLLLTEAATLRLTDEQMRSHPLWRGLPTGHVPLRGFLGVQMINEFGKPVGLISLSDKEGGEFTDEDETLIKHLAALASLALQHIQARSQLQQRAEQAEQGRQKLEILSDTLARTAADLAQSNKDLEQFAYVASHDLQEPLRMVSGFLNLLRQQYLGRLDKDADDYIEYAIEGATRMQNLVAGLLAYSRIGSQAAPFAEVELDSVLDHVLTMLGGPLLQAGAIIKRDPLPRVLADEMQMIQLYQNLLANAIKFKSPNNLQLQIGATREDGRWLFSVRDNGVGFPQIQAERAFLIFQRLHAQGSYDGAGIGLAICKRVVERHAGRIWVESEPGKGTTFYFTLNT